MSNLSGFVKRLRDIMRNDAGINGDAQRIEQMVWILFLKVYDAKEEIWEFYDENYTSIIPEELRWRNWAVDHKDVYSVPGTCIKCQACVRKCTRHAKYFEDAAFLSHVAMLEQNFTEPKKNEAFL